jgi:hypothetical protein
MFWSLWTIIRSIYWNLTKVTVSLKHQLKHIVKLLLWSGNESFSLQCVHWVLCGCAAQHPMHTLQIEILPLRNNNFNEVF